MVKKILERDVEASLVASVVEAGGLALKFVSPGRVGVPDRVVLMPGGTAYFVECKAPGKRPTEGQEREHQRLRELGFSVLVLDWVLQEREWLK